mmetsp:Transcript_17347/g.42658  ORF Transcript_17347/g.42658 Transcript_17347/m.42658 type:complete len:229 (-) Transcript_17347:202-888(-)
MVRSMPPAALGPGEVASAFASCAALGAGASSASTTRARISSRGRGGVGGTAAAVGGGEFWRSQPSWSSRRCARAFSTAARTAQERDAAARRSPRVSPSSPCASGSPSSTSPGAGVGTAMRGRGVRSLSAGSLCTAMTPWPREAEKSTSLCEGAGREGRASRLCSCVTTGAAGAPPVLVPALPFLPPLRPLAFPLAPAPLAAPSPAAGATGAGSAAIGMPLRLQCCTNA